MGPNLETPPKSKRKGRDVRGGEKLGCWVSSNLIEYFSQGSAVPIESHRSDGN